ncbi:DUF3383 family protein [Immundisolibacter sp.]
MGIEEIVKVSIVRGSKTITRAGFGTPLILSSDAVFTGVRTYNSLKSVEADFLTSTSVWKWANKLFGQEKKPKQIKVARRTALVAQVNTVNIPAAPDGAYTVTINGVGYTFNAVASSVAAIRTALLGAINAATALHGVTASNGVPAGDLVLTCVAGQGFSVSVTANMTVAATTANNGAAEDIQAAEAADDDFYCVLLTSRTAVDILNAAMLIESRRKIFLACTNDAGVKTNGANNIAALLKARGYTRTALIWSGDQANGPEAGWAGRCLPLDAGSETWKFKDVVGIVADKFTDTELANLKLNNVNNYRTIAGFSMMSEGQVAAGEFIDVIRFIDWLQAQIEENVFAALISVPKIPYTDAGVAMIENVIRAQLQRGINVGGLRADPAPEVVVPKVADVELADRGARLLPDISFNAQLAGAIHAVEIDGTVTV